ncbi:DUF4998 domain-containing protein [Niabella beijingensis]|uniref:DUF4998 domain-containing protein n=1 Tax=Niabella beijingensis TaxID=2872700 RepID=UPI001CBA90D0|nr:DUF4998 domain-containing protein [Niabella beijingensis]MBZ4190921.1 discoidin domain-containing protein [Niabella beijingensis]
MKLLRIGIAVCSVLLLCTCDKMDATYKDFIKDGSIVYTGSPDSIEVLPGRNRISLRIHQSDLSANRAVVYWDNMTDSAAFQTGKPVEELYFPSMTEGIYSFDLYLYDKAGNKSVKSSVVGRVYGAAYEKGLLPTAITSAVYLNEEVTLAWGSREETVLGNELEYTDSAGTGHQLYIDNTTDTTVLSDFGGNKTFRYRTLYKPDSLSLDTFKTDYTPLLAQGPPVEYPKNGWVPTMEDYDVPTNRSPANAIDNSTSTIWHMSKATGYPHQITVDMGAVQEVHGFTYNQRTPLDGAVKLVEIFVSDDGAVWRSLGPYTFANNAAKQYLDLIAPATFRHFRIVIKSDYKSGTATALAELGVYKR